MSSAPTPPDSPFDRLKTQVARGDKVRAHVPFSIGDYSIWVASIRHYLFQIYGSGAPIVDRLFPTVNPKAIKESGQDPKPLAAETAKRLAALVSRFEGPASASSGDRVFFGHGRSSDWLVLKDFVQNRLHLPVDEFNMESVAGLSTFERLDDMLSGAAFAFLVMTAEDEHGDGKLHARENVVHELGLFQGHLGRKRAIIVKEDGCAEFSNIIGLSQIRFPKGYVKAAFEDVRHVLEREGVLTQSVFKPF